MIRSIASKRKIAYRILRSMVDFAVIYWDPPVKSDRRRAELLSVMANEVEIAEMEKDIKSLKKGKSDPTPRMVAGIQHFFGKYFPEGFIESNFIIPFTSK